MSCTPQRSTTMPSRMRANTIPSLATCRPEAGTPISQVEGVFNAVVAEGDQVDATLYSGRGAGGGPTASAVVADIADIAKGASPPVLGVPSAALQTLPPAPMERHYGAYYFRLMVVDQPGVLADVAACLRDRRFPR